MKQIDGTHQGNKSKTPNTAAPRQRQKPTKAEARLAARQKDYDQIKQTKAGAFHRPGSLQK